MMVNNASKILRPVHPFPARMAPSIALQELPKAGPKLCVLDCMAGSGTTLAVARSLGHSAVGFDTDPLAVLIAKTWCADIDKKQAEDSVKDLIKRAQASYGRFSAGNAYPIRADEETRAFARFWFDGTNRRQLAALSRAIARTRDQALRSLFWCALSKTIITKRGGVSLAMDVSHSRPHRVYKKAPTKAFSQFIPAVKSILRSSPFAEKQQDLPRAKIHNGDARKLPLGKGSVDMVITSPPYLNAINYLRGHKLSLVWMGYTIGELRSIRTGNVGTEVSIALARKDSFIKKAMQRMGKVSKLSARHRGMIAQYIVDMDLVLRQIDRVLVEQGRAVLVVGDCTIKGTFVKNSKAIEYLGTRQGLKLVSVRRRKLPASRRYLPPPNTAESGVQLQKRMLEEVIIAFRKQSKRN